MVTIQQNADSGPVLAAMLAVFLEIAGRLILEKGKILPVVNIYHAGLPTSP
ncbi:hypothetical protein DPMN_065988 [Dreissena polymorpha]|uniref:Uncharacterized protein n=1 Tax=Dreissena polymorpha TaxID=45954 RepID=A0A9D3YWZ1_DREPO|nr:hypothetical protein DPMN_065988 [Dreissena polymorpha]